MSRTKQSFRNLKISSVSLIISILLNFVSRNVFIEHLGTDIVGLSSTLLNILGFLNLAELGLTSAIAGTLYEPLFVKDRQKIQDIISIFGFLYRIIGLSILIVGVVVSLFLPYFFRDTGLPFFYIISGYYTYLAVSLVGYFISYKQTLLVADQSEYVVTSYTYTAQALKFVFQIIALKYLGYGFVFWLIIELFFGLFYGFIINRTVSKKYPWLQTSFRRGKEIRKEYNRLFITIKQVIPHNVAAFVQNQSSNILIYAFSSLAAVTIYTNYTMILVRCVSVLNICLRGITASFGNLVAEGDKDKTLAIFLQFNSLFFIVGGVVCTTGYYQVESFINLWLGDGFLLGDWVFWMMIYIMYVSIVRLPVNYFIGGFVLYRDIWAPIAEAVINIVIAIFLGKLWGIGGVVFGSVVSLTLIIVLWKPYFLFKNGFRCSIKKYWMNVFWYILMLLPVFFIPNVLYSMDILFDNGNVLGFIFNTLSISIIVLCIYSFILVQIDQDTRNMMRRLYVMFSKK